MSNPADETGMPPGVLEWMHSLGYVHETEIETATSTTSRSRTAGNRRAVSCSAMRSGIRWTR